MSFNTFSDLFFKKLLLVKHKFIFSNFLLAILCVFSITNTYAGPIKSGKKPITSKTQPKNCASGIINPTTNQCWICSKESRDPIRLRVEKAKKETNALGGCKTTMSLTQMQDRLKWWKEFNIARDAENKCWQPEHSAHITEAKKALAVADACEKLIKENKK